MHSVLLDHFLTLSYLLSKLFANTLAIRGILQSIISQKDDMS